MKSFKSISLLVVILLLGFSGLGTRPAQAQSNITLQPGTYKGIFNIDVKAVTDQNRSGGGVNTNFHWNDIVKFRGTVDLSVTTPEQAQANLSYDYDNHVFSELRDLSVSGAGGNCTITGIQFADPTVVFLGSLTDNFDPQKQAFDVLVTLSEPKNFTYNAFRSGSSKACSEDISRKTMKESMERFLALITTVELQVSFGDVGLSGEVTIPGWGKTLPVPGGGGQSVRTVSGHWITYQISDKPKGWKK